MRKISIVTNEIAKSLMDKLLFTMTNHYAEEFCKIELTKELQAALAGYMPQFCQKLSEHILISFACNVHLHSNFTDQNRTIIKKVLLKSIETFKEFASSINPEKFTTQAMKAIDKCDALVKEAEEDA